MKITEYLILMGADVNSTNSRNKPILFTALMSNDFNMVYWFVETFVKSGANTDYVLSENQTIKNLALHIIIEIFHAFYKAKEYAMGIFLKITYDSQGGKTAEEASKNQKILSYIIDSLNDYPWQESIFSQLTTLDPKYSHISLGTILRFFHQENIEAGNLKSFYRYIKKDDKLIIDQMLTIDKYEDLFEHETRIAICDDIFLYFKPVILKYKDRFLDFDAVTFIPLLEERFEEIKAGKYINKRKQCE